MTAAPAVDCRSVALARTASGHRANAEPGEARASYRERLRRYLATAVGGIAVLFTFSAYRTVFDELDGAVLQAVYTLQIRDKWRGAQ